MISICLVDVSGGIIIVLMGKVDVVLVNVFECVGMKNFSILFDCIGVGVVQDVGVCFGGMFDGSIGNLVLMVVFMVINVGVVLYDVLGNYQKLGDDLLQWVNIFVVGKG